MDPSEYQIANVEVALLDIFVVVTTKLLLIPAVLEGCREMVLLSRVKIGSLSGFGLTMIVVLGVQSTKNDIHREDSLKTINHEEGGVAGGLTSLCAQPPYYSR
jgi:hypothetical protein